MADSTDNQDSSRPERKRSGRDRRGAKDRRGGHERRQRKVEVAVERRSGEDRRRKGPEGERRKVERRINEYVLKPEVLEFINAINAYKTTHQKPFPTWSEIYQIFVSLGYVRQDEPPA